MFIEHSLFGYRQTIELGSPFVEVDCFLLKDGTLGVMHDETLDRTTNSSGRTEEQTEDAWRALRFKVPAGVASDPFELGPPLFSDVLQEFGNKAILVVEAKNRGAGAAIVAALKSHGISPDRVLVNSFDPAELEPALQAGFPTSLAIYSDKSAPDPFLLQKKGYLFCTFSKEISDDYVTRARIAGVRYIFYTVNRRHELSAALRRGAIGVYSDEPIYLAGGKGRLGRAPFSRRSLPQGMLPMAGQSRGEIVSPDKWKLVVKPGYYAAVLHGWASPLNEERPYRDMSMRWTLSFGDGGDSNHWCSFILSDTDQPFESEEGPKVPLNGLRVMIRLDGSMRIDTFAEGKARLLAAKTGKPLKPGAAVDFGLSYQDGKIELWNFTQRLVLSARIDGLPGYYLSICAKSLPVEVSRMTIRAN